MHIVALKGENITKHPLPYLKNYQMNETSRNITAAAPAPAPAKVEPKPEPVKPAPAPIDSDVDPFDTFGPPEFEK